MKRIEVNKDGFIFKKISRQCAEVLFSSGTEQVYVLYGDGTQSKVESDDDLKIRDAVFGIEVDFLSDIVIEYNSKFIY